MEKTAEHLSVIFTMQALARRETEKWAGGPTAMEQVQGALSQDGDSQDGDAVSAWANGGVEGPLGEWSPTVRHGAIGAGLGGLAALIISKLKGRKWKDALWDSVLGAGIGGLGGAGYKLMSQELVGDGPSALDSKSMVGSIPRTYTDANGKKTMIAQRPDGTYGSWENIPYPDEVIDPNRVGVYEGMTTPVMGATNNLDYLAAQGTSEGLGTLGGGAVTGAGVGLGIGSAANRRSRTRSVDAMTRPVNIQLQAASSEMDAASSVVAKANKALALAAATGGNVNAATAARNSANKRLTAASDIIRDLNIFQGQLTRAKGSGKYNPRNMGTRRLADALAARGDSGLLHKRFPGLWGTADLVPGAQAQNASNTTARGGKPQNEGSYPKTRAAVGGAIGLGVAGVANAFNRYSAGINNANQAAEATIDARNWQAG